MPMYRLTIADILLTVFAIASLAGLYPVYTDVLDAHLGGVSGPTAVIFQAILPLSVVVFLAMLVSVATDGVSQ